MITPWLTWVVRSRVPRKAMKAGEGENWSCSLVASAAGDDGGCDLVGCEETASEVGEVAVPGRRVERGDARGAGR